MNINSPEELLEYMKNIKYGYLSKNGKIYQYGDKNFDKDWYDNYILENGTDVVANEIGNCWDQVEFEREWFKNNGYEYKTFFEIVDLQYDNKYPSHSYLCYKENDKWYWFENADYNHRGIHEFDTLEDLIKGQYIKYLDTLKDYNITDLELNEIKVYEFKKPKEHITVKEYLDHVNSSKEVL